MQSAWERIHPHIHKTPVLRCNGLDRLIGGFLYFKCENFQKVGAFKIRGATNAILSLTQEQLALGVATHSSGNHAAALALAARVAGVPAYIVMPENSPKVKKAAVASYGAEIFYCEPTLAAREKRLSEVVGETGAYFVHPYDNDDVIAGQGTCALEFLREIPGLDIIIAPVGGGGLLGGTAIAVKAMNPNIQVFGAEPLGANDAWKSFYSGEWVPSENPVTIADGLLTSLGLRNYHIIRDQVDQILCVKEESIKMAMRWIFERAKWVVEPSSAVPLATIIENPILFQGLRTGIILSGGNVELDRFPELIR